MQKENDKQTWLAKKNKNPPPKALVKLLIDFEVLIQLSDRRRLKLALVYSCVFNSKMDTQ